MRGILKALKETVSSFAKPPVTEMYPYRPAAITPRSRGAPGLLWNDELDEIICTGCGACARECPCDCIFTSLERYSGDRTERRTIVDEFYLDLALCCYCGICVEVCPYEAIEMTPEFAYSGYDVREMVLDMKELVALANGMTRTTPNPAGAPGKPPKKGEAVAVEGARPGGRRARRETRGASSNEADAAD